MKLIWKSKVSKHPLRDSLWFQNWQWWHENEGCDTAHYRVIWIHLGLFRIGPSLRPVLGSQGTHSPSELVVLLGPSREKEQTTCGWVKSQWRNPVASKPYIKQLTHRQRNHCNAEKSGKFESLQSCKLPSLDFHIFTPWYQRSGSETTPQAIRFFFHCLAWKWQWVKSFLSISNWSLYICFKSNLRISEASRGQALG